MHEERADRERKPVNNFHTKNDECYEILDRNWLQQVHFGKTVSELGRITNFSMNCLNHLLQFWCLSIPFVLFEENEMSVFQRCTQHSDAAAKGQQEEETVHVFSSERRLQVFWFTRLAFSETEEKWEQLLCVDEVYCWDFFHQLFLSIRMIPFSFKSNIWRVSFSLHFDPFGRAIL